MIFATTPPHPRALLRFQLQNDAQNPGGKYLSFTFLLYAPSSLRFSEQNLPLEIKLLGQTSKNRKLSGDTSS